MHFFYKKEGFALITALLFIGFLLALVLSISVLLKWDFYLYDTGLSKKKAKANAIIGLHIALGELQKKLGPDIVREIETKSQNPGRILDKKGNDEGSYSYMIEDLSLSSGNNSLAVLCNVAEGGLRQNLTEYLIDNQVVRDSDPIIKDMLFSPKWGIVKSFYKLSKACGTGSDKIKPVGVRKSELLDRKHKAIVRETTDPITVTHGVGPIIIGIKFALRPILYRDENAGFHPNMDIQYFLTVDLWNPYALDLNFEEYLFEIASRRIDDKKSDIHRSDNIIFLNENQRCRLNCEQSLVSPYNRSIFLSIIKSSFKAGEVKRFSLYGYKSNLDIKNGNLLIENANINNYVVDSIRSPLQGGGRMDHDKPNFVYAKSEPKEENPEPKAKVEEKEISKMRGGGKTPPKVNVFKRQSGQTNSQTKKDEGSASFQPNSSQPKTSQRNVQKVDSVSWGEGGNLEYTFSLCLRKEPQLIFQEIKELKFNGNSQINNPNIINNSQEYPLFAIIFENIITEDLLVNSNPRSQIIWIDDNNINAFLKKSDFNHKAFLCDIKDYDSFRKLFIGKKQLSNKSIFSFPKDWNSLCALSHCNLGLHENGPGFAFGNSFKNNYIEDSQDRNDVPYLYDLSYHLNKALWDSYYISGNREKNGFFQLSRNNTRDNKVLFEEQVLVREAFNVNSTSKESWAQMLSGLGKSPYCLKKETIEQVAKEIANQVAVRGPFKTLGEFINRRVDGGIYSQCGVIQSALNECGLSLHQYEILDLIGDRIGVRSDTFNIRVTGESGGKMFSKDKKKQACCEVLVQRVPEYMDRKNGPKDRQENLSQINKRFGRRFKIVSFRWLF